MNPSNAAAIDNVHSCISFCGRHANVHRKMNGISGNGGMIYSDNSYRSLKTRSTSVEALLRWSLTRDMLRAGSKVIICVFTAVEHAVHVTLTRVREDSLDTNQWIFSPDTRFEDVIDGIRSEFDTENQCYLFTPGRDTVRDLYAGHLGHQLTRHRLKACFPHANVLHLDNFARLAQRVFPRFIGADTRHWLEQITRNQSPSAPIQTQADNDYLTLAVHADSAVILRLLVTPGSALQHSA